MKLVKVFCIIISILIIGAILSACSLPMDMPEEGIWYCEELRLELNFNKETSDWGKAKIYNTDGTFQYAQLIIHPNYMINVGNEISPWEYLLGRCEYYEHNLLLVTTNDKTHTYVFVRIDE